MSPLAGDHRGWPAIWDGFLAKLGPLPGQTSGRSCWISRSAGRRGGGAARDSRVPGRRLDVTGCQLMRLEAGRIAQVHGHYSDQSALDAFWGTQ